MVAKCRHRPTGANVAVKMFKEFDKQVSAGRLEDAALFSEIRCLLAEEVS